MFEVILFFILLYDNPMFHSNDHKVCVRVCVCVGGGGGGLSYPAVFVPVVVDLLQQLPPLSRVWGEEELVQVLQLDICNRTTHLSVVSSPSY